MLDLLWTPRLPDGDFSKIIVFPLLCSSMLFGRGRGSFLVGGGGALGMEPRGCKPWEQESREDTGADPGFVGSEASTLEVG